MAEKLFEAGMSYMYRSYMVGQVPSMEEILWNMEKAGVIGSVYEAWDRTLYDFVSAALPGAVYLIGRVARVVTLAAPGRRLTVAYIESSDARYLVLLEHRIVNGCEEHGATIVSLKR